MGIRHSKLDQVLEKVRLSDIEIDTLRDGLIECDFNFSSGIHNEQCHFTTNLDNCPGAKVVLNEVNNYPRAQCDDVYINIAKLKLVESLKLLYRTEEGWIIPFPWLLESRFEAEDYFIPVRIDQLDRKGTTLKRKGGKLETIFAPARESTSSPRRIFLQGEPGYGKSTVCIKMANDWAIGEAGDWMSKYQLVILIRLRRLKNETLEEYVLNFCQQAVSFGTSEKTIKQVLLELSKDSLLLLDGLDETKPEILSSVMNVLGFVIGDHQSFLRDATILVTCRPNHASAALYPFDSQARICPISLEERENLIDKYLTDPAKASHLKMKIQKSLHFSKLSPLMITILCYLQEQNNIDEFVDESEIVSQTLNMLGKLCSKRERLNLTETEYWSLFTKLGAKCFEKFCSPIYTSYEIDSCFDKQESKFMKNCGVLRKSHNFNCSVASGGEFEIIYEVVHKTFVEFLAKTYLNYAWKTLKNERERKRFISSIFDCSPTKKGSLEAYDLSHSKCVKFTCSLANNPISILLTIDERTGAVADCNFLIASDAVAFHQKMLAEDAIIKVTSHIILQRYDSGSTAIPPSFKNGLDYFYPAGVKETYTSTYFKYHIHRDSKKDIDFQSLANKDHSVAEIVYFEYREQSRFGKHDTSVEACNESLVSMLRRAVDNSLNVTCSTQSFMAKQLLRTYPQISMQTLDTEGDYLVLQASLRKVTKYYLNCSKRFHAVPEDCITVKDFFERFYKSVQSSNVEGKMIISSWCAAGHVFKCYNDPKNNQWTAKYAAPNQERRMSSQSLTVKKLVRRMTSVNKTDHFLAQRFKVQLTIEHDKITLNVRQCEDGASSIVLTERSISWQVMKHR